LDQITDLLGSDKISEFASSLGLLEGAMDMLGKMFG